MNCNVVSRVKFLSDQGKKSFALKILKRIVFSQCKKLKFGKLKIIQGKKELIFGKIENGIKAEIIVKDPVFFYDIFTGGSIGAAEAYVQKRWETPDLDQVMQIFALNSKIANSIDSGFVEFIKPIRFLDYWKRRNTKKGSKKNIRAHYDLPDKLFDLFLDKSKMYSSAIFPTKETTLEEAQQFKLKTIAEKLHISSGDHILEICTGWGALAIYLAKNYDCHVTTTTISDRQYIASLKKIKEANLENKITLLKKDYRTLKGQFEKVVSIEMIEAVGEKFLGTYLSKISQLLKSDGLLVLQVITINDQEYQRTVKEVDFIKKYIFPGSFIPSIHSILTSIKDNTDMRLYAQNDFAEHYAKTLKVWKERFNQSSSRLKKIGLGEEFQRLWNFYFSYCIGGFKERVIGVSHLVFGKPLYRG